MSSNISANTLFHFTKTKQQLESILRHNFWPSLCEENNRIFKGEMGRMAIPMVCFCDIPLSNIEKHMDNYGNYAIGLKYSWARANGLNPIWYVSSKSTALKLLKEEYKYVDLFHDNDNNADWVNSEMYKFCFIKKFSERIYKDSPDKNKNIRYYDEREWRYVPNLYIGGQRLFLTSKENSDRDTHDRITAILHKHPLTFTPSDINYIIVRKDSEILETKHMIEQVKAGYSAEERETLVTKILSAQRIKNDF